MLSTIQSNIQNFLKARKRQWGTERDINPLGQQHPIPSSRQIAFSRFSIVLTILFWVSYVVSVVMRQFIEGAGTYSFTLDAFFYLIVVTFLTFSALVYLITRQGALQRFAKHVRVPRALLERYFSEKAPTITVLIPSYAEEPSVVRKTLYSAALQEYPNTKVVLLIDDDESKLKPEQMEKFLQTKQLINEIKANLSEPYAKFLSALNKFSLSNISAVSGNAILDLANNYADAANWLLDFASKEKIEDHVDVFFVQEVLVKLANDLNLIYEALMSSYDEGATLTRATALQLYNRLVWTFKIEISSFERKKYASLSHEFNKAMNINSYLGLMGNKYITEETPDGPVLVSSNSQAPDVLDVPYTDYVLTLDADSILLQEYCLRLVYFLEQPDNQDVAVTQTPYSSYRGASTRIERLAGATTDIQHILHQGMSTYNATFWVGANAVIRRKALEDIKETEWVGGYEIKKYVQDNTVIEDTESSIDLALHGWRLVNYPERLSYSATPPDFGSLVVQRRRWANGGLLILPKLFRYMTTSKMQGKEVSSSEFILRLNYMASIAWSNLGLVFLLAYPYDGRLLSPFVLLSATPYFISMAMDLKYCRYNYSDIFRIYGFNLILLPVNLAGVFKSLEQALTTKKIPFARTPKVRNRTGVALPYVLFPLFIIGFSILTFFRNIVDQNWGNAAVAAFNTITAIWAVIAYIGIPNLIIDIFLGIKNWFYVDVQTKYGVNNALDSEKFDWKAVLYHGETTGKVPHHSIVHIVTNKEQKGLQ